VSVVRDKVMATTQVKRFQQLQEQRTQAFHELDQHHKIFLCHAPNYENGFDEFKKGVSGVTERFQKISLEIIEIKKSLEEQDPPQTQAASMIARVQELEEKKLSTVVDVQLAKQQALDNPGDELCEKNANLIRASLTKLCEDINEVLMELRYETLELDPPA